MCFRLKPAPIYCSSPIKVCNSKENIENEVTIFVRNESITAVSQYTENRKFKDSSKVRTVLPSMMFCRLDLNRVILNFHCSTIR